MHKLKCSPEVKVFEFSLVSFCELSFSCLYFSHKPGLKPRLLEASTVQPLYLHYVFKANRPFYIVGLVTWPLNGSETGVDLVLIQTPLLLLCKSSCSYAN